MLQVSTSGFLIAVVCVVGSTDEIKKYDFHNDGLGNYTLDVEAGEFVRKEQGHLENENTEDEAMSVEGQVVYKVDDSLKLVVEYVADGGGYRPKVRWVFLPKVPPRSGAEGEDGGPGGKSGISGTVLGTLVGGNGK